MFRRFGLHHSGSSLLFKTRKYSTYEACLTRVQTAMKVKRVNEAVAKTAGLLFESEVDAEAKLSLQKFETRLAALNAKFQSNSSFVSKRTILEALFRKIAVMASDRDGELNVILNESNLPGYVKSSVSKGLAARMVTVNLALGDDKFRTKAWELLKLPLNLALPEISGESLHGDVSTIMHNPKFMDVYLSDGLSDDWATFFREVVKALNMTNTSVVIFSEELTALGEDCELDSTTK